VRDTGVGMDAETASRVFEPFFSTKTRSGGRGVGLSAAYGLVHQAGGEILVQSAPGAGATFEVYLPAVAPADIPPQTA
jgi:signal transduction histidine kinase